MHFRGDGLARPHFRLPLPLFALPCQPFLKLALLLLVLPPIALDPSHQEEPNDQSHGKDGHDEKNQFEHQSTVSIPRSQYNPYVLPSGDPVDIQTDSDGLRRVGTVDFKSDRVRLAQNLFGACMFIGYIAIAPLRGRIEPAAAIGLVYGILLPIGCVAYYLIPKYLMRSSGYRVTVHLDAGGRISLKYRDDHVKALAGKRSAKAEGEFRPRAVADGQVQLELRRNWRGNNEWLLYVPADVSNSNLEPHLECYLPLLTETLESEELN